MTTKLGPWFYGSYDGECNHCFGLIMQGDNIRYVDDGIACEECSQEYSEQEETEL